MEGLLQRPPSAVGLDLDSKSLPFLASQTSSSVDQELYSGYLLWFDDQDKQDEDIRSGNLLQSRRLRDGDVCVEANTACANAGVLCTEQRKMQMQEIARRATRACSQAPKEEDKTEAVASCQEPLAMVASLADCARKKDLLRGSKLHADIVGSGFLEGNVFVGCALLNMYAKCGAIRKAQQVFNRFSLRNAISWNALIAGYTQLGYSNEALSAFEQMQQDGFSPDAVTFACALKACGNVKDVDLGHVLHAQVLREGLLESNIVVANSVIDMYVKYGLLANAQAIFDELPIQDTVSWNVVILGYAQNGHAQEALKLLECMKDQGFHPDLFTFACVLKACANMENADKGQEVHSELIQDGLEEANLVVGSALVCMYANYGMLADAQEVFDELPAKNVVVWTTLIEGYAQQNDVERAFSCFEQMKDEGIFPDIVLFACILKASGSVGAAHMGQKIHTEIVIDQLRDGDMVIDLALLHMYADCGMLAETQEVFDELPVRNVALWTALLAIYAQYGFSEEAFNCFRQMQLEGLLPDEMTFTCILKACSSIAAPEKGQQIHAEIAKRGLLHIDTAVAGALVDMYAKCGLLEEAECVFDHLREQDVVSWSALVSGYAQHGHGEKALHCFEEMKSEGFSPNVFTFASILKACGSINAACQGKEIHSEIVKVGCMEDIIVSTALVDMYGKCGMLDEAQVVFEKLVARDVFSWSARISGYAQHAQGEEALHCLALMEHEGLFPNAITFISSLKACGNIGAAVEGQRLHVEITKQGLLEENIFISTALVYMYVNCGMVAEAEQVFDESPVQNLVSWNTLIAGYVLLGDDDLALQTYRRLIGSGKEPDSVTFTLVLNACSNRGLVDKGQLYFERMSASFGIMPSLEHCICIIDLFGRIGLLDYALAVIEMVPILPEPMMWHSVLASCQRTGNVDLGQWAFEHAAQTDEENGAAYVSMCNILYSS